jgi:hypothetical protein
MIDFDSALMEFETSPPANAVADDATVVGNDGPAEVNVAPASNDMTGITESTTPTVSDTPLVSEKEQMGKLEMLKTAAVERAKDMPGVVGEVNWATPSWDIFVVIFTLVAVLLYGLSLGRDRIIVILVSAYITFAVIASAPVDWVFADDFTAKAVAFPVLLIAIFFLLTRTSLAGVFGRLSSGSLWQAFIFSVLHVGLIVSLTVYFLPDTAVARLHPLTQFLFDGDVARLLWVSAPIVALALFTDAD